WSWSRLRLSNRRRLCRSHRRGRRLLRQASSTNYQQEQQIPKPHKTHLRGRTNPYLLRTQCPKGSRGASVGYFFGALFFCASPLTPRGDHASTIVLARCAISSSGSFSGVQRWSALSQVNVEITIGADFAYTIPTSLRTSSSAPLLLAMA